MFSIWDIMYFFSNSDNKAEFKRKILFISKILSSIRCPKFILCFLLAPSLVNLNLPATRPRQFLLLYFRRKYLQTYESARRTVKWCKVQKGSFRKRELEQHALQKGGKTRTRHVK